MANGFEWQTVEEEWPEEAPPTRPPPDPPRRRRRPLLLGLLLLAVAAGLLIQWQIQERIRDATDNVSAELLAAHNFLLETAAKNDQELLLPLLSNRDPEWTEVQKALVAGDIFQPRPHSAWQPIGAPPLVLEEVDIELDEALQSAELTSYRRFAVRNPQGVMEGVTLAQTAVYRRGSSRWLYAPPLEEFWQGWETFERERLSLVVPGRDADLGARLADDLDAILADLCALEAVCQPGLQVQLRLDNDPQAILAAADIQQLIAADRRVELPAPSLIGMPVDDAGYQALLRAYGEQLVTAVIADLIGYECCRWQRMQDALRDWQLAELGLIAWPLDEAQYEQLLNDNPPPQNPGIVGDGIDYETEIQDERYYQTRALVEFLVTTAAPDTSVGQWQRRFTFLDSASAWMGDYVLEQYQANAFIPAFVQFIYDQSRSGQLAGPPIPLPEARVNAVCDAVSNLTLYHYEWESDSWHSVYAHDVDTGGFAGFQPVYDEYSTVYDRIIINMAIDAGTGQPANALLLVKGEPRQQISYIENGNFLGLGDHSGRYIVQALFEPPADFPQFWITDLQDCDGGQCAVQPVSGWPVWSPDGEHMLVDGRYTFWEEGIALSDPYGLWRQPLYLAEGSGAAPQEIDQGGYPKWLTPDRFVYTSYDGRSGLELLSGVVGEDTRTTLFSTADLLEAIPVQLRPQELLSMFIDPILLHADPSGEPILFLQANDFLFNVPEIHSYYFQVRLTPDLTGVADIDYLFDAPQNSTLLVAPNGRWLALTSWSSQGVMSFSLFDRQSGAQQELDYSGVGWGGNFSPDGNWLIIPDERRVWLVAVGANYQKLLITPDANCQPVFWGW